MKVAILIIILFFSSLCTQGAFAQSNNFKIYLFESRYSLYDKNYVKSNDVYQYYDLFSQGYLESTKEKGHIDLQKVKRSLELYYPDKNKRGKLVLDFEGAVYQNLRKYNSDHKLFKEAEIEFINMVRFVKNNRPNLSVGIYGIPFKFYFENQKKFTQGSKFDKILREVDFIAPSLYVLWSENENKNIENEKFLKANLDLALKIAIRLDKPVIPFFWYMVNPINKKYGHEVISPKALKGYYLLVKNHQYNGKSVDGIFWWDVSQKYFGEFMNTSQKGLRNKHNIKSKFDLFKYYQLENF